MALSCCFEIEVGHQECDEVISRTIEEQEIMGNSRQFLDAIVRLTCEYTEKIDLIIAELATGWSLERIAKVDLVILRMAIVEILKGLEDPPPPDAVIINEAIVLAKKFSTADSGRFINGILASVVKSKEKYISQLA